MGDKMIGKKVAAEQAIEDFLRDNLTIGIGSGSTIVFLVEKLAELVKKLNYAVKCVPSSFQSKQLIIQYGLPLADIEQHPLLDICFDGADEIDLAGNMIKGGGGCHTREKLLILSARKCVIVVDESKKSNILGEKVDVC